MTAGVATRLATLSFLALTLGFAKPASADDAKNFGNWFLIKSGNEGFCLDASLDAGQKGHEVYIFRCHGRFNQRWTILDNADRTVSLVGFDGRCLDISGRRVGDGTPLQ